MEMRAPKATTLVSEELSDIDSCDARKALARAIYSIPDHPELLNRVIRNLNAVAEGQTPPYTLILLAPNGNSWIMPLVGLN